MDMALAWHGDNVGDFPRAGVCLIIERTEAKRASQQGLEREGNYRAAGLARSE
jgi:hypothetical protein